MHHYFIINPAAGQGKAAKLVPAIREYMEGEGLPFTIYQTKGVGDAMAYVRYMAKKGPARFYACGGDGTLNEVVNGLKKFPECEVALIPAGTGNDFLRNFTNMENFQDIAAQVAGKAVAIDVLQVNGRRVVNMTNTGFDSAVVAQAAKLKKIPFVAGPLAYVLAVAVLFCRPMGKDLSFRTDNGKEAKGKFLLTALANGKFYGGGFCPAPMAKINDGKLELVAVRKVSRWRFLHLVGAFHKGTYLQEPAAEKLVFQDCCTRVHIHAKETQKLSMDGEIVQCIPCNEIAYASNDRNEDTIAIECCIPDETGEFTDATYQSLIELTAWLMGRYDLTTDDVIRHYDVTGKMCPKYYVEHEDAWLVFKQDLLTYIDVNGIAKNEEIS